MRIVLDGDLEAKVRMGEKLGQTDEVLVMLRDAEGFGVCADTFRKAQIHRYSARFTDLRKLGWTLTRRTCENPSHDHRTQQFEWILGVPAESTLF